MYANMFRSNKIVKSDQLNKLNIQKNFTFKKISSTFRKILSLIKYSKDAICFKITTARTNNLYRCELSLPLFSCDTRH